MEIQLPSPDTRLRGGARIPVQAGLVEPPNVAVVQSPSANDPAYPMHLLLIEDDPDLSDNIVGHLQTRGHVMNSAADGISGMRAALANSYDALILDIALPGMDGLTLCQKLRQVSGKQVPVLMLTARDTLEDKLSGFDAGADDYLVKPFELAELEARLKALARRGQEVIPATLALADLTVDTATMDVRRAGRRIALTPNAFKLLVLLMKASPRVVTRRELGRALWGDQPPESDALRTHIHALRAAIDKPYEQKLLHTLHGIGFRMATAEP